MADTHLSVLPATVLDNVDERQIEFDAEGSGDIYAFAVRYRVLEALSGSVPDPEANVVATFGRFTDQIERAAATALARGSGIGRVVIDEGDLV